MNQNRSGQMFNKNTPMPPSGGQNIPSYCEN